MFGVATPSKHQFSPFQYSSPVDQSTDSRQPVLEEYLNHSLHALLSIKPPVKCHNAIKWYTTNHILASEITVDCKLLCMQLYQTPPPPLSRKSGTESGTETCNSDYKAIVSIKSFFAVIKKMCIMFINYHVFNQ